MFAYSSFGLCPRCGADSWARVRDPKGDLIRCHGCRFEVVMALAIKKDWFLYSATHTTAATGRRR